MSSTDLESLESRNGRSRHMDMCLVGSVVVLFVLVISGFAVLFAWNLKPGAEIVHEFPQALRGEQDDMSLRYKGQNFAYLRASIDKTGKMSKGVMDWEPITYGNGKTLGSGYEYDANQRVLTVKQAGAYFLYVQFNVSCNHKCKNETLTITFTFDNVEQLTCTLELPDYETVAKKCWTVIPHMDKNSKLMARIHSDEELRSRVLEVNSSGFGMFRVDGPGTD
ncbi:uncharacterized protein LOC103025841 [Astyanax mexicanus]|uniref:uncharacterized protein LOC103025841 n=1 Tax=Astyanax mexicanus TaxID=7994 RepID=UPI0020CAAD76|nr:uncharacterized protein LOC103025841 [Astyanax mexicanus]